MKTLDVLGLDEKKVNGVVSALNQLLADFQVYYMNLRGLHWNVKGKGFFTLHAKYEELYNDAAAKVDVIAERLLQLGSTPENRFSAYLRMATLQEDGFIPTGHAGLEKVLEALKVLIAEERKTVELAGEANDEVTVALMDDFLTGQEKLVWMITSFLTNHPDSDDK